jgi:hypothetical protein
MRLPEFSGDMPEKSWFQAILDWSRKKLTFDDNLDGVFVTAYLGTSETEVGHPLGRTPRYVLEVAAYPNGTAGISFTKSPNQSQLFLKRSVAGNCTLWLM